MRINTNAIKHVGSVIFRVSLIIDVCYWLTIYSHEKNIYYVFFIDLIFNSECIDFIPFGSGGCSQDCSFWSGIGSNGNEFGLDCDTDFPSDCQLPGKVKDYCHKSCRSNCNKGKFLPFRHLFAIFITIFVS